MVRLAFLLLSSVAFLVPAQSWARPTAAPIAAHQVLQSPTGFFPHLRVVQNEKIDVVFIGMNHPADRDWRWNVTTGASYPISEVGEYGKFARAHRNHVVSLRFDSEVGVYDLRDDSYVAVEQDILTRPTVFGLQAAWPTTGGIRFFDVESRARSYYPGVVEQKVTGWEDWFSYRAADKVSFVHRPSGLKVEQDLPGRGQPDVAYGKVAYLAGTTVSWEFLGHPGTGGSVSVPLGCVRNEQQRIGGSWGQFVAYVGVSCAAGVNELRVVNMNTGAVYFVGEIYAYEGSFDIQENVISYLDLAQRVNVVVMRETEM